MSVAGEPEAEHIEALEVRSIHYRRRWFYVLWCALLLASAGAWVLWVTPRASGTVKMVIRLKIEAAPRGCRVQAWAGPRARWAGDAWHGENPAAEAVMGEDRLDLPPIRLDIAFRRWIKDYIPSRTSDLLVIRFVPPTGQSRYFFLPLEKDWRSGLLRVGWVMNVKIPCPWQSLGTDAMAVPEAQ
jgi:hypothetical protein